MVCIPMQSISDFITARQRELAILGSVRLTPLSENKSSKREKFCSPGWNLNVSKRYVHAMNCKRRNCDFCGWYWAWKWRKALKEKSTNDRHFGIPVASRALTLTFAENIEYLKMQRILEDFWLLLRRGYPGVQYWGAVEFNQAHTQPHIHFILSNCGYIELDYLDYCFKVAQKRSKVGKLAFNLRIEKIRKNVEAYFTKYITKLTGGKDEIPRRENWQGRFIRYSKGFFPIPVPAMLAAAPFNRALERGENFDRFVYRVRKPRQDIIWWIFDSIDEEKRCDAIRVAGWQPEKDIAAGTELEPDNLLTGVEVIPVYYDKEFSYELYCKMVGYNTGAKTDRLGPAF